MSATFVICVHDFPHGEVSVKVGVMEFGLKIDSTMAIGFMLILLQVVSIACCSEWCFSYGRGVRLSVCPSHSAILSKQCKLGLPFE